MALYLSVFEVEIDYFSFFFLDWWLYLLIIYYHLACSIPGQNLSQLIIGRHYQTL